MTMSLPAEAEKGSSVTDGAETPQVRNGLLGENVARLDGPQFVSGRVAYAADLVPRDALHLAVLRSPHACATIVSIDMSQALACRGVVAGLTGEDAARLAGPMPPAMALPGDSLGRGPLQSRCLAVDKAVYFGQGVAAIVAETVQDAQAALAAIEVSYRQEHAVLDADEALREGAPVAQPGWSTNVLHQDRIRSGDAVAAFARASHVVNGEMRVGTSTSAPMETPCYIGNWDDRAQRLTLTGTFQNPHTSRWLVAQALGLCETDVRVIAPRMGGTFGLKMAGHPEELLVAVLSRLTGRPVAYVEERTACLLAGARSQHHRFELAADADGRFLGLRDRMVAEIGIVAAGHSWAMALVTPAVFPTVYAIEHCDIKCTLAITNHAPWQAIRGYGKEIGNLVMERAVDLMAEAMDIDPAVLRQRNLVPKLALPRLLPSGLNVDSGDYPAALDQLLTLFGYEDWRRRQSLSAQDEKRLGIGLACELTPEGGARPGNFPNGYETATVRLMPSGNVQVATGVTSPGSGSDTGIAQMVAGQLGLRPDQVRVIEGDTDVTPVGTGNASSRALMYGGMAAYMAAQEVGARVRRCAANLLGGDASDIHLSGGFAVRAETGERIAVADIALGAHLRPFTVAAGVDLPLEVTRSFAPGNVRVLPDAQNRIATYPTFSYSMHAVALELDTVTGVSRLLDYALVHDCGTMVNPALVEGQVKGAVAMGIGAALWEELTFDSQRRLVSDRLKTYLMPRSLDLPPIRVGHRVTPNPFHPLGMKGAGESGLGGALAAVVNAVADAQGAGTSVSQVPATPPRVLAAMQKGTQ